jgi:hypothetical protein
VFLITLEIVLISLTAVVFPALITRTVSPVAISIVDPLEPGILTIPILLTNFVILGLGIAYFKGKLPYQIIKSIKFIFNFEVSKKVALVVLVIILGLYIAFTINELSSEEALGDYSRVKRSVEAWSFEDLQELDRLRPHVRTFLLSVSLNYLDNIRIIPFLASISLLILTYLITLELSKKRFAGLVSVVIILQSPVFLKYDTTATYENFWTVFYIFSLYTIYKFWPLSPFAWILSILSKPITSIFLPMTLFLVYKANISRRKKIALTMTYITISSIALGIVFSMDTNVVGGTGEIEFVERFFWNGFVSLAFQLRYDYLVILFLLPLTFGLFIASQKGIIQSDSILMLIAGILFSAPILTGFTDITNQPYRFVPLVVFFAMGVGVILTKRKTKTKIV